MVLLSGNRTIASQSTLQKTTITIYGDKIKYNPSPLILGSNVQWEHLGDGLYDLSTTSLNANILPLIKSLGITTLRYPGGTLADKFDWKSSIGPISSRGQSPDFVNINETIYFGIDEFMSICEQFNLEPVYIINFNTTPSDAVQLIEYLNGDTTTPMGLLRANNGHAVPYNVKYFEIGNELYGYGEPGHCTVEAYAAKFVDFRTSIKNSYPNVQLGVCCDATFQKATWASTFIPDVFAWNAKLANLIPHDNIDFLSCHFYGPFTDMTDQNYLTSVIFTLPQLFTQTIIDIKKLFPGISTSITEYNVYFNGASTFTWGFESALFDILMLKQFIENEITFANHWSLIGNSIFGMIDNSVGLTLRPTYKLFQLFAQNFTTNVLTTDVLTPTYSILGTIYGGVGYGVGSIPPMQNVPILEAITFKSNTPGQFSIFVINKDIKNIASATILLKNFQYLVSVNGSWLYTGNNDVVTTPLSTNVVNNIISLSLPPKSIALLQLQTTTSLIPFSSSYGRTDRQVAGHVGLTQSYGEFV